MYFSTLRDVNTGALLNENFKLTLKKPCSMFKLFLSISFVISFSFSFCQSFNLDDTNINIDACTGCASPGNNTYLNALSDETVYWSIIDVDIPEGWEFSNCFPNCYPIGTTSGELSITSGEQYYLNCHVYPNEIMGEGTITMQISDNKGTVEDVTWSVFIGSASLIENALNQKEILGYYTLEGKKLSEPIKRALMFVVYEDGTSQQIFITE